MTPARLLEEGLRIDLRYFALLALWVAATAAAQRFLPDDQRKGFLAFSGLLFLALFLSSALALALLAFSLLMHQTTAGRLRTPHWLWWAILLALGGGAAACGGLFTRPGGPTLGPGGEPATFTFVVQTLFLLFFLKKTAYYLYEVACGRTSPPPLDDFLVYFFAPSFMTGLTPTVSFAHLQGAWQVKPASQSARAAAATVGLALLHWLAAALLAHALGRHDWLARPPRLADVSRMAWGAVWLGTAVTYVRLYLVRYGFEQTSVGLCRLLGWSIRDNYEDALTAGTYLDAWRRWNIHHREFLMAMFYYPALLGLTRRNRERGIRNLTLACGAAFLGAGLSNVFSRMLFLPAGGGALRAAAQIGAGDALEWLFITGAMIRSVKAGPRPPPRGLRAAAGVLATFTLRAATVPIAAGVLR